jgi:hypothetical protein
LGILARDFQRKRRRLFIFAFPPWRSDLQRPAAVKGGRLSGRRQRTLDDEDRCEIIRQGGKVLV